MAGVQAMRVGTWRLKLIDFSAFYAQYAFQVRGGRRLQNRHTG